MNGEKLSVLYVDDDDDIREIVKLSLGLDPSIDLAACDSAARALELLEQADWQPNIVLLDVMMPHMDGPTLMKMLRERAEFAEVPFVLITARARTADVAQYKQQGATDVILKPFDPIGLAAQVRQIAGRG